MTIPTPDPSLIPTLVGAGKDIFTTNWSVFLVAGLTLLMGVTVPLIVLRGALSKAIHGIKGVFSGSKA